MALTIARPLKVWQKRVQSAVLSASGWYRKGYARKRLHDISEGNAARTVDVEQDLLRLGSSIVPVLLWALERDDFSEYQKRSIIRVLVGLGDARGLAALCRLVDDDSESLGKQARKDLRVLCLRLDRKGELPEEYRPYLGRRDGTSER